MTCFAFYLPLYFNIIAPSPASPEIAGQYAILYLNHSSKEEQMNIDWAYLRKG